MQSIKKFGIIRIILLIIGSLALLNGALYALITILSIGSVILMILSSGLIVYAIFYKKIPKMIHIIGLILCLIPISFIIFLTIYGNTSNVDYDEDVIIVMGAGVRGERVSMILARRLDSAIEYLSMNPNAMVIVCGGLGDRATITEAEAMKRYLVARGIAENRIIKEDLSTNSYENLLFAKEILEGYFPDGFRAVITTSDFHLFRTLYVASNVGIDATRIGARTDWYALPSNYMRELLAIVNVFVFPPWGAR